MSLTVNMGYFKKQQQIYLCNGDVVFSLRYGLKGLTIISMKVGFRHMKRFLASNTRITRMNLSPFFRNNNKQCITIIIKGLHFHCW
jgi:hypothetical protein